MGYIVKLDSDEEAYAFIDGETVKITSTLEDVIPFKYHNEAEQFLALMGWTNWKILDYENQ